MKIKIEVEENLIEDEVIIRCSKLDSNVQKIQQAISSVAGTAQRISFYKEDKEYYLPLSELLFFETSDNSLDAHTADNVYHVKYRLYELEEILPSNFTRVSKSTILNLDHIFSITHNLTSSSIVEFYKSHKQVYVSRYYYKYLKERLKGRRNYEK